PTMPSYQFAGANDHARRHGSATIGSFGGQPIEETPPERRERVSGRAGAEAPAPQPRCRDDDEAARRIAARDDDATILFTTAAHLERAPLARGRDTADRDRRQAVPGQAAQRGCKGRRGSVCGVPLAVA